MLQLNSSLMGVFFRKAFFILFFFTAVAFDASADGLTDLRQWNAGRKVSLADIRQYGGVDRCFTSMTISDKTFSRIKGKSYKANCTTPCADLRYIKALHYNNKGEILIGEMICHKDIAADLVEIFRVLFDERYPIERMVLVDEYGADDERSMKANNSSAFNFRNVPGTRSLSKHSLGLAVDINPFYNPYVYRRNGRSICSPDGSRPYANRQKNFPYKIKSGDACHREFTKRGFTWGGNWRSCKDYQHFEKKVRK